jgi:hypothetical protein
MRQFTSHAVDKCFLRQTSAVSRAALGRSLPLGAHFVVFECAELCSFDSKVDAGGRLPKRGHRVRPNENTWWIYLEAACRNS